MNIAFPAFLIFLLVLPGFIFYSNYHYLEKTSIDHKPFAQKTIECFGWSILFHLVLIILIYLFTPFRINFSPWLVILSGHLDDITILDVVNNIKLIVLYFLFLYFLAFLLGYGLRKLITGFKLDKNISILRINNRWYYLFKGYNQTSKIDAVYVAVLTEIGGKAYLYAGVLNDFCLDDNGNLDRIVLCDTERREIEKDKNSGAPDKDRFYPIDSDYFVIPYSEVKNLNVQFVEFEEKPE